MVLGGAIVKSPFCTMYYYSIHIFQRHLNLDPVSSDVLQTHESDFLSSFSDTDGLPITERGYKTRSITSPPH
jgi:hypothetical protein